MSYVSLMEFLMLIRVHPRVAAKRPEITPEDVRVVFTGALRSRPRDTDPVQWVGVGIDTNGRLLEFIAIEEPSEEWLVFHVMPATKSVLLELGLRR
ncbi:MAG: hypothetical protein FWF43_07410 [Propionibacteriaceae bacterium]|nr:hypothetical protein [Propionibacteriaceae bacterium]